MLTRRGAQPEMGNFGTLTFQPRSSGSLPCWMPVSSSYIACDVGPTLPSQNLTVLPLYVTDPTGATTTAVPVQKHSSAFMTSSMETLRSSTVKPRAAASSQMDLRVIPGRIVPCNDGVEMVFPLTQKKLHELTSSMYLFS